MKIGSNKKKSTFPAIPEKSPKGTDHLAIVWNDKSEMKYPSIWLRDNCRCTKVHFDTILSVNKTTTSEPICSEHEKTTTINLFQIFGFIGLLMIYTIFLCNYSFTHEGSSGTKLKMTIVSGSSHCGLIFCFKKLDEMKSKCIFV